jgi:hypothetical protein
MAQANGLQPGKQSPLLFIEQAIEQQDGSLELVPRCLEGGYRSATTSIQRG